jgi:hypothetical protein
MNQLLLSPATPEMERTAAELSAVARAPRGLAVRAASSQDVQPLPFIAHATDLAAAGLALITCSFVTFATDGFAPAASAFVFMENGDA